ncbi:MAG: phospholipid carrier-dependent glycosyltransferase [Chloroflexaceae bacterium]|nr:phospholipid carrier-dependent glycosyltransferase [Chloroflexaceae bacterium]
MLRRLFAPTSAVLAALLWATDPFIIGYSRLLHVDGLMGTCATLSLLAACCFWNHSRHRGWLVVSGICTGLAVLSKSPALALVPVVGALALARDHHPPASHPSFSLPPPLATFLAWGGIALLTVVALWPALWVSPVRVYEALRVGVEVEGAQPHMTGNFFLGHSDPSPDWRFYPAALVLRTTPWALVGLLLLPWAVASREQETPDRGQRTGGAQPGRAGRVHYPVRRGDEYLSEKVQPLPGAGLSVGQYPRGSRAGLGSRTCHSTRHRLRHPLRHRLHHPPRHRLHHPGSEPAAAGSVRGGCAAQRGGAGECSLVAPLRHLCVQPGVGWGTEGRTNLCGRVGRGA